MSTLRHQHPVHPRGNAGGYPLAPWILLGTLAAAAGLSWLAWAAGHLTARLVGEPATGLNYGSEFVGALLRGQWDTLWPGLPPVTVAIVFTALVAAATVPVCVAWAWWNSRAPEPATHCRRSRGLAT